MSNRAITWAYARMNLKTGPKFVLVALADLADQDHSCFPGVAQLAEMTGAGESTVKAHLDVLFQAGYITRERRHRKDGSRTSNRYYLAVDAVVVAPEIQEPDSGPSSLDQVQNPDGLSPESRRPKSEIWGGILEPPVNPQKEPKALTPNPLPLIHPGFTIDQFFEQFWQWYPRHEAKKPAREKFTIAARKVPPAQLVAAAIRYRDDPNRNQDPKLIPYASTWLHQERWADEIAAPATPPPKLSNAQKALALAEEIRKGEHDAEIGTDRILGARVGR